MNKPNEKIDALVTDLLTSGDLKERQQLYADVVAKYYGDPDFKAKMDADPTAVLKAEGFDFPEGAKVKLVFNTSDLVHILLPAPSTYRDAATTDKESE